VITEGPNSTQIWPRSAPSWMIF